MDGAPVILRSLGCSVRGLCQLVGHPLFGTQVAALFTVAAMIALLLYILSMLQRGILHSSPEARRCAVMVLWFIELLLGVLGGSLLIYEVQWRSPSEGSSISPADRRTHHTPVARLPAPSEGSSISTEMTYQRNVSGHLSHGRPVQGPVLLSVMEARGVKLLKANTPMVSSGEQRHEKRSFAAACILQCGSLKEVDAMKIMCDPHHPCSDAPFGKMLERTVGYMIGNSQFSYRVRTRGANIDKWAQGLGCGHQDAWRCMFGNGEFARRRKRCRCLHVRDTSNLTQTYRLQLRQLLLRAIVLEGDRTSPLLTQGPAAPPFRTSGASISVHVRAGDSCDDVSYSPPAVYATWEARNTSDPSQSSKNIDFKRSRRGCVHPSVHFAALRGLMRTQARVEHVLLATDSSEAVDLFERELRNTGITLHTNRFDRRYFEQPRNHALNRVFIEHRALSAPVRALFARSALEDMRLLARGEALVADMCGQFARIIHDLMVAWQEAPVEIHHVGPPGCRTSWQKQ